MNKPGIYEMNVLMTSLLLTRTLLLWSLLYRSHSVKTQGFAFALLYVGGDYVRYYGQAHMLRERRTNSH